MTEEEREMYCRKLGEAVGAAIFIGVVAAIVCLVLDAKLAEGKPQAD